MSSHLAATLGNLGEARVVDAGEDRDDQAEGWLDQRAQRRRHRAPTRNSWITSDAASAKVPIGLQRSARSSQTRDERDAGLDVAHRRQGKEDAGLERHVGGRDLLAEEHERNRSVEHDGLRTVSTASLISDAP